MQCSSDWNTNAHTAKSIESLVFNVRNILSRNGFVLLFELESTYGRRSSVNWARNVFGLKNKIFLELWKQIEY